MIEVRPPRPDDVDRLAEINLQSWRAAYAGIVPQGFLDAMDARQYEQKWRDRLADPSKPTMCVAVIDGVVSSYAVGGPYRQQQDAPPGDVTGPQLGEIYAIYSHPQMWGRGAGLAVHETMLATLAVAGYTELALWVLQANDASRRWYSRRGWKPDGVTSQWEGAGAPLTEIRLRHPCPRLGDGPSPAVPGLHLRVSGRAAATERHALFGDFEPPGLNHEADTSVV